MSSCYLCGKDAPPDRETGAPPDNYCPDCKPFEEAHEILSDWLEMDDYLEEVRQTIQYAIEYREPIDEARLGYLEAIVKAVKAVPIPEEDRRAV